MQVHFQLRPSWSGLGANSRGGVPPRNTELLLQAFSDLKNHGLAVQPSYNFFGSCMISRVLILIYNIQLLLGNFRCECRRKPWLFPYKEFNCGKSNLWIVNLWTVWPGKLLPQWPALQKLNLEKLCFTIICQISLSIQNGNIFGAANDAIFSWIGYIPKEYWFRMHGLHHTVSSSELYTHFVYFHVSSITKNKQSKKPPTGNLPRTLGGNYWKKN